MEKLAYILEEKAKAAFERGAELTERGDFYDAEFQYGLASGLRVAFTEVQSLLASAE